MKIVFALLLVVFSNFTFSQDKLQYSKEFYDYFQEAKNIRLNGGEIIFEEKYGSKTVDLPLDLILNKKYLFSDNKNKINLQLVRINYTDIEYIIEHKNFEINGKASISPAFYFGLESIETSKGGFWLNAEYFCREKSNCLVSIGIGNQKLTEETKTKLYAYIKFINSSCSFEFPKNIELLKLKTN